MRGRRDEARGVGSRLGIRVRRLGFRFRAHCFLIRLLPLFGEGAVVARVVSEHVAHAWVD